jgi:hypothetical protein
VDLSLDNPADQAAKPLTMVALFQSGAPSSIAVGMWTRSGQPMDGFARALFTVT